MGSRAALRSWVGLTVPERSARGQPWKAGAGTLPPVGFMVPRCTRPIARVMPHLRDDVQALAHTGMLLPIFTPARAGRPTHRRAARLRAGTTR